MPFLISARSTYLRLNVLEQNLQLYGLSPESKVPCQPWTMIFAPGEPEKRGGTYAVADVAEDEPSAGTSCHIDCRSKGCEPPLLCSHDVGSITENYALVTRLDVYLGVGVVLGPSAP
jgi:hypothetical protein